MHVNILCTALFTVYWEQCNVLLLRYFSINDRVLSANNVSLESVEYAKAVQVLRDSGPTLHLVIKRRIVVGSEPQSIKLTLTKSRKKDGKPPQIIINNGTS